MEDKKKKAKDKKKEDKDDSDTKKSDAKKEKKNKDKKGKVSFIFRFSHYTILSFVSFSLGSQLPFGTNLRRCIKRLSNHLLS